MRRNALSPVSITKGQWAVSLLALMLLGASGIVVLSSGSAVARLTQPEQKAAPANRSSDKLSEKASDNKTVSPKEAPAPVATGPVQSVISTDLLKDPGKFLNKRVSFDGTFNSFSSLGLDYKPAFRNAKDHVSFLVLRPDVMNYNIPMSELKLIVPRKKVESIIHLDQGDKVLVKGQVFSTALGEPWLDVSDVTILQKAKGKEKDASKKAASDNKGSAKELDKATDKSPITKTPDSKPVDIKTGEPKTDKIPATKQGKLEKIKNEKTKPLELPPDKKSDNALPPADPKSDAKPESKSESTGAPKPEKP